MIWVATQVEREAVVLLDEEKRLSKEYAEEVAQWAEAAGEARMEVQQLKGENEELLRRNRAMVEVLRRNNLLFAAPGLAAPI